MLGEPVLLHSLGAEMTALGSTFFGERWAAEVVSAVGAEDFFLQSNQEIFRVIKRLHMTGKPVDPIVVRQALVDAGKLDDVGGDAYLIRIQEMVPSPQQGRHYAEIVREYATLRRVEQLGFKAQRLARESGPTAQEKIGQLMAELATIHGARRAPLHLWEISTTENRERFPSMLARLNETSEGKAAIVKGQVTVVLAREGVGKSTWMLAEFRFQMESGRSGLFYTLGDLNQRDIIARLVRQDTGWASRPKSSTVKQKEWDDAHSAIADQFMETANGHQVASMVCTGKLHGRTFDDVVANIIAAHHKHKLDVVFIDYFQRIRRSSGSRLSPYELTADQWLRLADLAEDLEIAIIVASQETTGTGEGLTKGARDGLEAAALVLRLEQDIEDPDVIILHVQKARFGASRYQERIRIDRERMVPMEGIRAMHKAGKA